MLQLRQQGSTRSRTQLFQNLPLQELAIRVAGQRCVLTQHGARHLEAAQALLPAVRLQLAQPILARDICIRFQLDCRCDLSRHKQ